MRLASFGTHGGAAWGIVDGENVIDLTGRWRDLRTALSQATLAEIEAAKEAPSVRRFPIGNVVFAPVIPNSNKVLCVGHNYDSHRRETNRDPTQYPSIFVRFADSMIGHGCPIVRPRLSTMLDYEGELAVIIGKGGRAIGINDAFSHVAGYACFNDASIRDWQWHTKQFTPGKNFPGTGACGPWMVTVDEITDPSVLSVTTRVNGETVQAQPTADMIFPIPEIIAYVSAFTQLTPGDIIATGTPGGVGAKRNPPRWLGAGDRVEIDIPGIGLLVNVVEDEV